MKRWILGALAALLLLPCAFAQTVQPPTHETECDIFPSGSYSTVTCMVSGLTGGEAVILQTLRSGNPTLVSLTDSVGQTPVLFDTKVDGPTGAGFDSFILSNASAGSHTFTLTVASAVSYLGLRVDVFANVPTVNPIDIFTWKSYNSCVGATSGTQLVTSTNSELVFAYAHASAGTPTAGIGFTLYGTQGSVGVTGEGEVVNLPGPVTATVNAASGGLCEIETVALRSAQIGAAGPPRRWTQCDVTPSSSNATVSCTVNGLLGGETILLDTNRPGNTALVSLTDSAGQVPGLFDTHVDTNGYDAFLLANATAGSHTFTLTIASAQTYLGLRADVFANTANTNPIDAFSWSTGCTGTVGSGAPVVTTLDDDLIFAWAHFGSTALAGPGYQFYPTVSDNKAYGETRGMARAGGATASFAAVSGPCDIRTVTLKSASTQAGYVTMVGSGLQDQSGSNQLISNATACFQLANLSGSSIGVHNGGGVGGQVAPRPSCGPVNNGALVGTWQPSDPTAAGTNFVPDPAITGLGTSWTNSGSVWTVIPQSQSTNMLALGSASSGTDVTSQTATITVVPGQTYTFSGYIDASQIAAGAMARWALMSPSLSTVYVAAYQTAPNFGTVRLQWTAPAGVTSIAVVADSLAATIPSGTNLYFGLPLLQAGSARLVDAALSNPQYPCEQLTITDNLTGNIVLGGPASGYSCLQPQASMSSPMSCSSGICNLDTYVPSGTPGVTQVVGPAPSLAIGNVSTLPAGSNAAANVRGGPSSYYLDLSIPQGPTGATGASGGLVWVKPESYGAVGNLRRVFNAYTVMPGTAGFSKAVTSPLAVTANSNDVVVTWFGYYGTWSSKPAAGTSRIDVAADASHYGGLVLEQTVSSPQTVAAVAGSISTQNDWNSGRVVLKPILGQTITYVGSSSVQNSTGSSTITVNVPSGVANGDWLLGCVVLADAGSYNTIAAAAAWGSKQYVTSSMGSVAENPDTAMHVHCWTRVASSEPSSYSWTQGDTYFNFAFIIAYRNVAGIDGNTAANQLQSVTAGFSASDVGKLICLQKSSSASNGLGETCGTITAYNAATSGVGSVTLSFTPGTPVSGVEAVWASDDYAYFYQMLTTPPCAIPGVGCHVYVSSRYGLSNGLALSGGNLAFAMTGDGAGMPWSANNILSGIPPQDSGVQLVFLTTSLASTTPGLLISGGSTINSSTANVYIANLALIAGAGYFGDGAGGDGVDLSNWQGAKFDGVQIANFAGNGWVLDGITGPPYAYTENTDFDYGMIVFSHGAGIKTGSTATNIETLSVTNSDIEANGGPGFNISYPAVMQALRIAGDTIQWNNRNSAAAEITFGSTGQAQGCDIRGNYFEPSSAFGGRSNAVVTNTASAIGCDWGNNKNFIPASVGLPRYLTFSVAGTALPACSASSAALQEATAFVTDAPSCTAGAIYAGGGAASTTATFSGSSTTLTVASGTGIVVGQIVAGANIVAGSTVTGVSGTTITISPATTGSGSGAAVSFGYGCKVACRNSNWTETGYPYAY